MATAAAPALLKPRRLIRAASRGDEQARVRIAGLRLRGDCPELGEGEPHCIPQVRQLAFLSNPAAKPIGWQNRARRCAAPRPTRQASVAARCVPESAGSASECEDQSVTDLRIQTKSAARTIRYAAAKRGGETLSMPPLRRA